MSVSERAINSGVGTERLGRAIDASAALGSYAPMMTGVPMSVTE